MQEFLVCTLMLVKIYEKIYVDFRTCALVLLQLSLSILGKNSFFFWLIIVCDLYENIRANYTASYFNVSGSDDLCVLDA